MAKRMIGSGCRLGSVSGVGRGMVVLDGVEIVEGKGSSGGSLNVGHHIVTIGNFVA